MSLPLARVPDPAPQSGDDLAGPIRVSDLLSALSFALDLTEGHPFGHTLRTCLIAMRLADQLDLPLQERRDLYYATLLKDIGCSSSSARVYQLFGGDAPLTREGLRRVQWSRYFTALRYAVAHSAPGVSWVERARRLVWFANAGPRAAAELVETRCARGAAIVTELGFGAAVASAIGALEERWDGRGQPRGLRRTEIPMLARIIGLAQAVEVFSCLQGPGGAIAMARTRRGAWYDPTLVKALLPMEAELLAWNGLDQSGLQHTAIEIEPGGAALLAGPGVLDRVARGFAGVVDAKSPFTALHSVRVTELALEIGAPLGVQGERAALLRRAALLHDVGKLSVPNVILDKPAPLSDRDWEVMRRHPFYTHRVLVRVGGFQTLAFVAAAHHERLDGGGYFQGLTRIALSLEARVLAVADVYEALTSDRPYRAALSEEQALDIMEKLRGVALDSDCLDVLTHNVAGGEQPRVA